MTDDVLDPDWADLARLPRITAESGDLDVVELAQRGLIAPILRLTQAGSAALADVGSVVVRDVEATPLLLGHRSAESALAVRTLRPVAPPPEEAPEDQEPSFAVIVRDLPTPADLARLDALTTPRMQVLWLVLAGRTRAGRRLQAALPGVLSQRAHGEHRILRVPWPDPDSLGVFERPELPSATALAAAHGVRNFMVVGEGRRVELRRRNRGGAVVFLTGLSGSGKSTIARALRDALEQRTDREITLLDGDDVRRMLSSELGFDAAGRAANVRRVSWVAALLARHGGIAITALIAPFAEGRAEARQMTGDAADFLEVWVSTPLAECERRDRKGLYARARAGELPDFTGIDSPYESPQDADIVIDTTTTSVNDAVQLLLGELAERARRRGADVAPARPRPAGDLAGEGSDHVS